MKNYMEEVVENTYDEIIEELVNDIGVCKCKQCRLDVIALALNKLPPNYVVSTKGEMFSKINALKQQFCVDAIAALTNAAKIIAANPRHEKLNDNDNKKN